MGIIVPIPAVEVRAAESPDGHRRHHKGVAEPDHAEILSVPSRFRNVGIGRWTPPADGNRTPIPRRPHRPRATGDSPARRGAILSPGGSPLPPCIGPPQARRSADPRPDGPPHRLRPKHPAFPFMIEGTSIHGSNQLDRPRISPGMSPAMPGWRELRAYRHRSCCSTIAVRDGPVDAGRGDVLECSLRIPFLVAHRLGSRAVDPRPGWAARRGGPAPCDRTAGAGVKGAGDRRFVTEASGRDGEDGP